MEEIEKSVPSMLDYHLQMLQQAGLIEIKEDSVVLTDFGKNFMETKDPGSRLRFKKDLAGTKPLEVVEVRQLLPCIADSTVQNIARFELLGGALKLLEPCSLGQISGRLGPAYPEGNILITIYSTARYHDMIRADRGP